MHHHTLEIDLDHMAVSHPELAQRCHKTPGEMMPLVGNKELLHYPNVHTNTQLEAALLRAARAIVNPTGRAADDELAAISTVPEMQATLKTGQNMIQFRELNAERLTSLVRLPGIVINASQLSSKATELHLQCKSCRTVKMVKVGQSLGADKMALPRRCDA